MHFSGYMLNLLVQKKVILPLMIATFIMQSVAFITLPSQVRTTLNFLLP